METRQERVNDYVKISINQASVLCCAAGFIKEIARLDRFAEGKSTSNYKITFSDGDNCVLRLYPGNSDICRKEYALHRRFHEKIPMPNAIFADDLCRIFPRPYMLMEFVDGSSMSIEIAAKNNVNNAIMEAAAALAVLHENYYIKDGALDENLEIAPFLPIRNWYSHLISGIAGGRIGKEMSERVRHFTESEEGQGMLDCLCSEFVLSHGDFRAENMLVNNNRLAAILDFEFALSAPRYFDLAQFIRFYEMDDPKTELFISSYINKAGIILHKDWFKIMRFMDLANFLSLLAMPRDNQAMFDIALMQIEKTMVLLEN